MAHKPAHDHGPNKPVGGGIFAVAQAKVRAPAIALLIVGVLYVIGAIGGAIYVSNPAAFTAPVENNENLTPEERQTEANLVSNVREIFEQNSPLVLIADVILSIIILIGGYKMLRLTSIGWARVAAMAAMIPCLSPVCVLGIPIGIWALIVSLNDDVKEGFRRGPGIGPPRTDK